MSKIFFAIYDDAAKSVPFRIFHKTPNTIYRTADMGFIETLGAEGFEPSAVLLEEDIADLKSGSFSGDLTPEDVEFLTTNLEEWALPE